MENIPFDCSNSLYSKYQYDTTNVDFISLIHEIYNKKYSFDGELCNLHSIFDKFSEIEVADFKKIPEIGVNDRKSIFIRDYYNFFDTDTRFLKEYTKFITMYIKPLFPEDMFLLYQSTPNIRISFPDSTAIGSRPTDPIPEIIGLHSDSEFGHPKDEINFVIPITEMYDSNSIYFEKEIDSNDTFESYHNLHLQNNEFFRCYFNKLRHYNRINETGKTRISLDFRIIPYSKYGNVVSASVNESISSHKQLKLGEYFNYI
jgi:hypothetical protein